MPLTEAKVVAFMDMLDICKSVFWEGSLQLSGAAPGKNTAGEWIEE